VEQVAGELIRLHRSGGRALEDGASRIVAGRNQAEQAGVGRTRGTIGERGALRGAQDVVVEQEGLLLTQSLIAKEEEGLVAEDRSGEGAPEVITDERILPAGLAIEEIPGVEVVVAQIVERLAMEAVRP